VSTTIDSASNASSTPVPVQITVDIGDKTHRLSYERAFALGCSLFESGHVVDAAKLFERLEEFTDRGPRAFIMQAFCEAAAAHYENCSTPLIAVFKGNQLEIASALHNAFISYHVGIRKDAINSMIELVNQHRDLPTLCLLLGNMFMAANERQNARKCWSLAMQRDRPGGAVARVAIRNLRRIGKTAQSAPIGEEHHS
jgi:hypothetical protein